MKLSTEKLCFPVLLLTLLLPASAFAGTPDAAQSVVQECLVTCPGGDTAFLVTVNDAAGLPCAGAVVEIDFCGCTGQQLCNGNGDCSDGATDKLVMATDAAGQALFSLAAGGECDGLVDVNADGVLLAQRELKTYDTTGNFIVEADDMPDFNNPATDFNCDGAVDLTDLSRFNLHLAHFCEPPVALGPGSWGSVKARWP